MTGNFINQPVYTDHRIGQRVPIAEGTSSTGPIAAAG